MRAASASPLGPSRRVVYRLAALFSLDSFAGGLAVQSMLALWLFERFELSLAAASVFFFWSSTLGAFSNLALLYAFRHVRPPEEQEPKEREPKEREPKEQEPKEQEPKEQEPKEREPKEREPKEQPKPSG